MANKLHSLALAVASQFGLHSPLGQFILAVAQRLATGPEAEGGCCMNGVIFGNVGSNLEVVPLACTQPDDNYIVTGVFAGGDISTGIEFAITAKTTTTFTIAFEPGVPVGGLLMDFLITRC